MDVTYLGGMLLAFQQRNQPTRPTLSEEDAFYKQYEPPTDWAGWIVRVAQTLRSWRLATRLAVASRARLA